MTFDDLWVDEVQGVWCILTGSQSIVSFACIDLMFKFGLYFTGLTYNQLDNNLTSQAATMSSHGLPNNVKP